MKLSADFSSIYSLWARYSVSVCGTEKSQNLSITLRRGSTSGFLASSIFLCCPKPPSPKPPLPLLSDFLFLLFFCSGSSAQVWGGGLIHSTLFTRIFSSPNYVSSPSSTFSSDVLLHEFRNTYTIFCIMSMISDPNRWCPEKALPY